LDQPAIRKSAGSTCHIFLLPPLARSLSLPHCAARSPSVTRSRPRRHRFVPPVHRRRRHRPPPRAVCTIAAVALALRRPRAATFCTAHAPLRHPRAAATAFRAAAARACTQTTALLLHRATVSCIAPPPRRRSRITTTAPPTRHRPHATAPSPLPTCAARAQPSPRRVLVTLCDRDGS
jgi:hypothetical protein